MNDLKEKLEDYTEAEFLHFIATICDAPAGLSADEYDAYTIPRINHFAKISGHPAETDLIFYPRPGVPDTPEGILQEVKEWREKNGLPGFKQ